ncbi:MAG: CPBP family intramembrane metalloprotease [Calditrichaeota bacterium]|nr:CPBP family intramembrane metalloprotease [Calditrichota bacterium]
MKTIIHTLNPAQYYNPDLEKPTLLILGAALIPTVHRYFGSMEFYQGIFPQQATGTAAIFMFCCAFLLMGALPALIVKYRFKESLKDYGLRAGRWKEGLLLTVALFIPISLLLLLPSSQTTEMVAFYPFDKSIATSAGKFMQYQLLRGIFFYTAWEFFFRGFLLFGLRPVVGDWLAICIQTIPSCLWHIGMPSGEIFGSIVGGILFGLLALRTRSLYWPFLLHFLIGIGMDFFIVITH